jgi:hypothetical protein
MRRFVPWCLLIFFAGCGNSPDPAGPGNFPLFELTTAPPQITPGTADIQIYIHGLLPNEFGQLHGELMLFSSSSPDGFFNLDTTLVDTAAPWGTMLNPDVWYRHIPGSEATQDTLYAHCVDFNYSLLAWDSCIVAVIP